MTGDDLEVIEKMIEVSREATAACSPMDAQWSLFYVLIQFKVIKEPMEHLYLRSDEWQRYRHHLLN